MRGPLGRVQKCQRRGAWKGVGGREEERPRGDSAPRPRGISKLISCPADISLNYLARRPRPSSRNPLSSSGKRPTICEDLLEYQSRSPAISNLILIILCMLL